jgi:hypothetical protein
MNLMTEVQHPGKYNLLAEGQFSEGQHFHGQ